MRSLIQSHFDSWLQILKSQLNIVIIQPQHPFKYWMLIGRMNNTSNTVMEESWNKGTIWALPFTMVFVEFTDGQKKVYVGSEWKPKVFLERTCSDVGKELQPEIRELLPATFHFMLWGSPLSLVQELGNCAVQVSLPVVENNSEGYPEKTISVFGTLCY